MTEIEVHTVYVVIAAIMGLLIGSFLTVVIDRVPRGASIVRPGSSCGACGLELGPLDLVPVLSWVLLRGKCRRCRTFIGIEPLLVESITTILFVLIAVHFDNGFEILAYCVFAAGLLALSVIDLKTHRLPRQITYVVAAMGAVLLTVAAVVGDEPRRLYMALIGASVALAVMSLLYLASRGGLGDGDVRLSPLLGMFLGWLNPGLALVGLFYGFTIGAVVGVSLMIAGRAGRKTALPFGPFLAAGSLLALFYGQGMIDLVLGH